MNKGSDRKSKTKKLYAKTLATHETSPANT